MSFSFKYKKIPLKSGRIISRPFIPLTLLGRERIDVIAILDSGSDMTVIPKEVADILDVKYIGEDELSGITGTRVKAKQGKINISFGKDREVYNFQIPIIVPEGENIPIVIGRLGFFERFKIIFFEKEKKIIFQKVSEITTIY